MRSASRDHGRRRPWRWGQGTEAIGPTGLLGRLPLALAAFTAGAVAALALAAYAGPFAREQTTGPTPAAAARGAGHGVAWAPDALGCAFTDVRVVLLPPEEADPVGDGRAGVHVHYSKDGDGSPVDESEGAGASIPRSLGTRTSVATERTPSGGGAEDRPIAPKDGRWRATDQDPETVADEVILEIDDLVTMIGVAETESGGTDASWTALLDRLRVARPERTRRADQTAAGSRMS